jgi:hypothetical protein
MDFALLAVVFALITAAVGVVAINRADNLDCFVLRPDIEEALRRRFNAQFPMWFENNCLMVDDISRIKTRNHQTEYWIKFKIYDRALNGDATYTAIVTHTHDFGFHAMNIEFLQPVRCLEAFAK